MAEGSDTSPLDLRDAWRRIRQAVTSRTFIVLIARVALIELMVLLVLGFGVTFIAHGLLMIAFRLSPHLPPARKVVSGLIYPYPISDFMPVYRVRWWSIPAMIVRMAAWLLMAGVGIWFLAQYRFSAQNFACLLLRSG